MKQPEATCACGAASIPEEAGALASFAEIRAACPALQKVLVPDAVWPEFQDWCTHPDDVAEHRSVVWEAYVGGCLDRVTSPIHQYVLEGWSPLCTKQYRQDLQEAWMRKQQPLERHKKWRIFYGHLVELQFAAWLEEQGYAISGLEATNEKSPDVEAVSPAGVSSAFEVKFVGSQDADFEMQLKSLAGQPSCDTVSPYQAINFLAFRAYEAAKQLQRFHANRTAVLVIDRLTSGRFEPQLKEGWINWSHPQFVCADGHWKGFIAEQNKKYPELPDDLAATICTLDAIWIVQQSSDFKFCRKYNIRVRGEL